jgi:hypothetical protein
MASDKLYPELEGRKIFRYSEKAGQRALSQVLVSLKSCKQGRS